MQNNKPIYVTQPSLAPLEEVMELLRGPWESGILTHNGPLVQQFEEKLSNKLGLDNFTLVTNGTVAIQMAIKALELQGEIITTPFTWVATISAIKWEGCTPVFCDIDPETFNMDPSKIEDAITDKTVAIMPVHVFGTPCDVEAIEAIAKRHNLKVIYDAAHAIGSTFKGEALMKYGDIVTTSLHATKLLNTAEGGGCTTTDEHLNQKLRRIRFFGHDDTKEVIEDGFNGKVTEVHAALGLANLKYYDKVLEDRSTKYNLYKNGLSSIDSLTFQVVKHGETNYSYFPVVFETEEQMLRVMNALNEEQVFPRRYFYPSVNTYTKIVDYKKCPVSEDISSRILCLPLYLSLTTESVENIIDIIKRNVE